ncbi:MAG: multiheme c-type cytochrome, partial [Myxococcota bacterium]
SHAYQTLIDGHVQYNLECVGCHVTGYGKPGGSTVTHNADLQSVQCETCHGPGSKHAENPGAKGLITLAPDPQSCVSQCHHPPHIEGFDPVAKMDLVLGPGHGK